jgi:hypothetical protein
MSWTQQAVLLGSWKRGEVGVERRLVAHPIPLIIFWSSEVGEWCGGALLQWRSNQMNGIRECFKERRGSNQCRTESTIHLRLPALKSIKPEFKTMNRSPKAFSLSLSPSNFLSKSPVTFDP